MLSAEMIPPLVPSSLIASWRQKIRSAVSSQEASRLAFWRTEVSKLFHTSAACNKRTLETP